MLHHVYGTSVFSLISKSSRLQIQMKKLIKSYIIAALCLPAFASCSSDFLDTTPTQSVSTATALSTTSNGYKVLNGIAKSMSTQQHAWSQGCAGENRIIAIYENYMDNDFAYTMYEPGWATLMNGTFFENYTTSYATYPWFYYYNIIGQANTVIAHIDAAEGSQADIQFIKASALTFRAYAYEKLLHYYSVRWQDSDNGTKPGVVLRLDESVGEMPRSTMAECYAQIYSDLDDAISLFGASGLDREKGKIWLPNLNVAHAVYARAALTRQDYSKALSEAKNILELSDSSDDAKAEAVRSADAVERRILAQSNVENILEAKGFSGALCYISDGGCTVTVRKDDLKDDSPVIIKDAVLSQLDIEFNNIVIVDV